MNPIDLLSWFGAAALLYGLKLIGEKRLAGFYVSLVAELAWIAWSVVAHAYAMVVMSAFLVGLYVRAIWLWKKADRT